MSSSRASMLIREWGDRFQSDPLAARVVAGLRGRAAEIWRGTFELLQRESPEYRNSIDDEFTAESKAHCHELLKAIIAIAAEPAGLSTADPFDFVRMHAAWRARHQVPLIASLHAYRLAHRTYWEITRDSVLRDGSQEEAIRSLTMLSDFWIRFFDLVGAVLAEAHAVEESLIVAQSTRSYAELIEDLLRGVQPRDAEAQRLCTLCGIRPGAPMAVLIARPLQAGSGKPLDVGATLRSFVRLLERLIPPAFFGKLIDIRKDEVTAIACSESTTALRIIEALRANRVAGTRNGHATVVGVGLDALAIASLQKSHEEARMALEFANSTCPIMHFAEIDLPELLVRRADSAAIRLIPDWARHFNAIDDVQSRELTRTVRVFADCSFNVKRTAQRLGVHTNTVYFRLNRVKKLTGSDPRTYDGTSLFLTAMRLLEVHGGSLV